MKAFEELLQASDVDYDVAEGFREQLKQSVLLFEKLEMTFLYGEQQCFVLVVTQINPLQMGRVLFACWWKKAFLAVGWFKVVCGEDLSWKVKFL